MKRNLLNFAVALSMAITVFGQNDIVHYWHFNNQQGTGDPLEMVPSDFSATTEVGEMRYEGTGDGYIDYRTFRPQDPVSNLNLQLGELADEGAVLRLRNPAETRELEITASTEGFANIHVNYAVVRTGSGAQEQAFYYSINGGNDWVMVDEAYPVNELNTVDDWSLISFDLSTVEELSDNTAVLFKLTFPGEGADNTSGNNRLDNFSITGEALVPSISAAPTALNTFEQEIGAPSAVQTVTISGVNLEGAIDIVATGDYEISLVEDANFSANLSLTPTENSVEETIIYVRLNSAELGDFNETLTISSENANSITLDLIGNTSEEEEEEEETRDLIYYWHFNNLETPEDVKEISADFSLIPGFVPKMTYTGEGNRDIDENTTGSLLNIQMDEVAGKYARVRNRSEGRSLIFNLNTSNLSNLKFEYAVFRSGSGMLKNIIHYSLDGGATFTQDGLAVTEFDITENFELKAVDLSEISGANNNPDFQIRITWEGNTEPDNGNNRYDNITLKGDASNLSLANNAIENASVLMYPNPSSTAVTIKASALINEIQIIDMTGKVVASEVYNQEKTIQLPVAHLENGMYMVNIINETGMKQLRLIKQ